MVYNPATDFLALWRNTGGSLQALEMPGLDYVIEALARAGVISVTVSATAPVANQSTTAWLQAAVPSYSAEGTFQLWDKVATAYAPATPKLFLQFLEACAGESGVSWWTSTGGAPANTVGNNGDFAIRLDTPNGIYGPKAAGAWPAAPIPGTADVITSTSLDNTFGGVPGSIIFRGASAWQALPAAADHEVLQLIGGLPAWVALSALLDSVFSSARGAVLYRGATLWSALGPGTAGLVLTTQGPTADPNWTAKTAEFPSGTVMLFQQTAAPPNWTKQTALDNYGLRVTAGAVGSVAATPFTTVFSQTTVGAHQLTIAEMPGHTHPFSSCQFAVGAFGITGSSAQQVNLATSATSSTGGDGTHSHTVSLALSYVDVIIATKN